MKRIIKLSESDLTIIVKRILSEQNFQKDLEKSLKNQPPKKEKIIYQDPVTGRRYEFNSREEYNRARKNLSLGKEVQSSEVINNLVKTLKNLVPDCSGGFNEQCIDDLISLLSALIGVIPGLGQLGSAIIDVLHGISFLIRYGFQNDERNKWKYIFLGLLSIVIAFDPTGAGGNVLFKTIQGKIDRVMYMTPVEVLEFLGFKIVLSKTRIPSWQALILKFIIQSEIGFNDDKIFDAITWVKDTVKKFCNELKSLYPQLYVLCPLFDEPIKILEKTSKIVSVQLQSAKNINLKKDNNNKCDYIKKWKQSTNKTNAGTIQTLLKDFGYNINVDWNFGDETATAVGSFLYGENSKINTVNKLWSKMKNNGLDVGSKTGFGIKMAKSVADQINKKIDAISLREKC